MDNPFLINGKLIGLEVDNPQIYRLNKLSSIIESETISISKELKPDLGYVIFCCVKVMAKMEKLLIEYIKIKNNTIKKLQEGQYKRYHNSLEWEDPTFELHDCFSEYLIQACIALKYKTRFSMLIFNSSELKDHKKRNKRILKELENKKNSIGEEYYNSCIAMINEDIDWLVELIQFRNETEHVEDERLDITDFKLVTQNRDITGVVFPGLMKNRKFVHIYMEETFFNVFTHLEDFFAMLINLFCKEPFQVIKVMNNDENLKEGCLNDVGNYNYEIMPRDFILKKISSLLKEK